MFRRLFSRYAGNSKAQAAAKPDAVTDAAGDIESDGPVANGNPMRRDLRYLTAMAERWIQIDLAERIAVMDANVPAGELAKTKQGRRREDIVALLQMIERANGGL